MSDGATIGAAADAIRAGGVVAYPTEAVYGLGCDPLNRAACERILALKGRDPGAGFILISAHLHQLTPYIGELDGAVAARVLPTWPGPATWLVPGGAAPPWIRGRHPRVAVRVTAHPVAAALCNAFGGALVSTSANLSGEPPARTAAAVRAAFGDSVDAIVDGDCGDLAAPTPIHDAVTGETIRA